MPFFLSHHFRYSRLPFGSSMTFSGLLFTVTGIAILAAPELLAYFVATLLIIIGITLLSSAWKARQRKYETTPSSNQYQRTL